jgi:microcin C transport system permease protein
MCFGELLVNSRALVVSYEGGLYFPTYTSFHAGTDFGLDYSYEVNYRDLKQKFMEENSTNWVLMPPVPYNPYENHSNGNAYKPEAPSKENQHYLGTDTTSRDILARLIYGTRIALMFSLAFMACVYIIGISIGCAMGYFGGIFDLAFQRLIEIWSNIPFLYMVIIVFSVIPSNFSVPTRIAILLTVMVLFSWPTMTYYMRTETYKEKSRDYIAAARIIGASNTRIIFSHILPNVLSTLVTFMPFIIVSAISAITALDFLGFGLPPPTPSLGELLKQGTANLRTAPWIVTSAFGTLVMLLTLVTFIGEAIRESFDPKKFTVYK